MVRPSSPARRLSCSRVSCRVIEKAMMTCEMPYSFTTVSRSVSSGRTGRSAVASSPSRGHRPGTQRAFAPVRARPAGARRRAVPPCPLRPRGSGARRRRSAALAIPTTTPRRAPSASSTAAGIQWRTVCAATYVSFVTITRTRHHQDRRQSCLADDDADAVEGVESPGRGVHPLQGEQADHGERKSRPTREPAPPARCRSARAWANRGDDQRGQREHRHVDDERAPRVTRHPSGGGTDPRGRRGNVEALILRRPVA